ncbi:UNVERIFIED_CONTAM: hypothetical protein K2H54_059433 [Gekko kuhli]
MSSPCQMLHSELKHHHPLKDMHGREAISVFQLRKMLQYKITPPWPSEHQYGGGGIPFQCSSCGRGFNADSCLKLDQGSCLSRNGSHPPLEISRSMTLQVRD